MVEQPSMPASAHAPRPRAAAVDESPGGVAAPEPLTSATLMSALLDAAPDGLLLLDAHSRLSLVNARVEELFGYPRDHLLGQRLEQLVPDASGSGGQLHGRRRDGSRFPVEISLSPMRVHDVAWTVVVIRDVSDRHLVDRLRESAAAEEQTRIAEQLADSVIRGLFGAGLQLQGLIDSADGRVRDGLLSAVDQIDTTIRDLRTVIFGRRMSAPDEVP
jgi:two-component system sensor histidine kinase DevS